jgi:hypothetical protein
MINRLSKLTIPVVVATATLSLLLSRTVGLANTSAKTKAHQTQIVHLLTRQTVQPQKSAVDRDHDADGFYMPTRSPR